ncbi:MAG: arylsulfatase [Verrucomicrobiales bacterium]|nr:arylsulfatase [Verrucomicrobiales bacterium]
MNVPVFVALAVLVSLGTGRLRAATPPRPNIVFVLADDLGYGDVGCYGQQRIRTPRLDRMAAEGMRFTRFYAGSTVCAPSRSVLMQGLHTGHCRVRGNAGKKNPVAQALRADDRTVARALKEAGYATGLFGKWGLGDVGPADSGLPLRQGFDAFFGYLNQTHAHNYYPSFLWRDETRVPLANIVPHEDSSGAGVASHRSEYSHDLVVREAFEFVRKHREHPFFLFLALTLPHANNEAGTNGMEVPHLGPYADTDWPPPQRAHAAMIDRLDRDVGRLLDLVDELGLRERTLVVFSSDNGPHREGGNRPEFNDSNGPLRGIKRDLYEGGVRVPFVARWPGTVPAGTVSETVAWFPDFFPTAARLAGAEVPGSLDGVDLFPVLSGDRRPPARRDPLYWEFHEGGFKQAVLDGKWKAVRFAPGLAVELYDLDADPGETRDLAAMHPDLAARLGADMARLRSDSPDWPLPAVTVPAATPPRESGK